MLGFAASSCEQRVEVLTAARDAGLDAAASCGACPAGSICSGGQCQMLPDIRSIAAGDDHTCLISSQIMFCAGSNSVGQLGMSDTSARNSPTRVRWADQWFAVAAGAHHTCGLRGVDGRGTLHCWGKNDLGQLGYASGGQRMRGSQNRVGDFNDWTQLSCGGDNCCALREAGALYCWGANADGSAGQSNGSSVTSPTRITTDSIFTQQFSVGGAHSCAIRSDKALLCWGKNAAGQLGLDETGNPQRTPVEVGKWRDWSQIAAGGEHTCGIRGDHELYCWGSNELAQLGSEMLGPDGEPIMVIDKPESVALEKDWQRIVAGGFHTCALRSSRDAYCWGSGTFGQLGTGTKKLQSAPTKVLGGIKWLELGLGRGHSCGVSGTREEPTFYCWGDSDSGKLGLGETTSRDTPTPLGQ